VNPPSVREGKYLFFGFQDDVFLKEIADGLAETAETVTHVAYRPGAKNRQSNPVGLIPWELLLHSMTLPRAFPGLSPALIEPHVREAFQECWTIFLRTIDRVFLASRSIRATEEYFHSLLGFILSYFRQEKAPDRLIFASTPHFPPEVAFFFVAKHLHIETIILRRSLLDSVMVLTNDFRPGQSKNIDLKRSDFETFKDPEAAWIYARKKSPWLAYSHSLIFGKKISGFSKETYLGKVFARLPASSFGWLRGVHQNLRFCWNLLVRPGDLWYWKISRFCLCKLFIGRATQSISLKKWLYTKSRIPKEDEQYALFALQFQPERTTDPECGVFSHQLEAVRTFRQCLPSRIPLFLKEHPRQIMDWTDLRRIHFRTKSDYEKLSKLPNTYFLHPKILPIQALDGAVILASGTGSMVWEGALLGKPGILFGSSWHEACEATPIFKNLPDCRMQIERLIQLSPNEIQEAVKKFLVNSKSHFIQTANSFWSSQLSNCQNKLQVKNLTEAIQQSCKKSFPAKRPKI
jgi:hypothetical protein